MPITEKELLAGFLSKTLNIDANGVAALYNADGTILNATALDDLLKLDSERIGKIKPDTKKFFDDGYKKAQSEVATKVEKKIAEAIGFETDKIGDDYISDLTNFVSELSKKTTTISDDAVKLHPVFKAREKELSKLLKESEAKTAAEVERVTKENAKALAFAKVEKSALTLTKSKKPLNIPADETKAEKQLRLLVTQHLNGYDFKDVDENGIPQSISKDGKRVEDAHGHAMSFYQLLEKIYSDNGLEFQKVDPKQSPSGDGKTIPETAKKPIVLPKNEAEYLAFIDDDKIPIMERKDVMKAWNKKAV